jgi:pyridoxamine 5'-phosphate oxidase
MSDDPLARFKAWYAEARGRPEIKDASAFALATADKSGRPAVRMVLLKDCDARGFVFYTNLTSPKASDLVANPRAALCFHWAPLGLQVRIEGSVTPVSAEEADAYFATRPRLSQLGAWASRQSQPMPHRHALATELAKITVRHPLGAPPRPPHWSGFRVAPARYEFWREGAFRHHTRELFQRAPDDRWAHAWLFP